MGASDVSQEQEKKVDFGDPVISLYFSCILLKCEGSGFSVSRQGIAERIHRNFEGEEDNSLLPTMQVSVTPIKSS